MPSDCCLDAGIASLTLGLFFVLCPPFDVGCIAIRWIVETNAICLFSYLTLDGGDVHVGIYAVVLAT